MRRNFILGGIALVVAGYFGIGRRRKFRFRSRSADLHPKYRKNSLSNNQSQQEAYQYRATIVHDRSSSEIQDQGSYEFENDYLDDDQASDFNETYVQDDQVYEFDNDFEPEDQLAEFDDHDEQVYDVDEYVDTDEDYDSNY